MGGTFRRPQLATLRVSEGVQHQGNDRFASQHQVLKQIAGINLDAHPVNLFQIRYQLVQIGAREYSAERIKIVQNSNKDERTMIVEQ